MAGGFARRQAATDDPDALVAAFRGVVVVINCAVPFTRSGTVVVRAAVTAGFLGLPRFAQPHLAPRNPRIGRCG